MTLRVWFAMAVLGQAPPAWQSLGPAPIGGVEYTGRVSAIACSRTNPNRYFVGGADGGVWRTTDGGANWVALTDAMPTTATGAIAIDPTNENVVYVGTGEANFAFHSRPGVGLYKSTDGGDTWTVLAASTFAGRCFSRIAIDPTTPTTLYAGTTRAGGFAPPSSAAKGHPQAGDPVGVFKSTDGGTTWSRLSNGLPGLSATDLAMDPANSSIIYAGICTIFGDAANGVYKSINGGALWTRLAGGLPTANVGRISLAVAPTLPQRVFAAVARAADSGGGGASTLGVYRSDNSGSTWTVLSTVNYMATYGWYLNAVRVHPTDANTVFVGGLNMRRLTNAGVNWTDITPPHVDLHAIEFDVSGRLLAGDDGGLHRSANNGSAWSPLNAGLGIIQLYAGPSLDSSNAAVMYGGAQDNGTNKRGANGTWSQVFGGDGGMTAADPLQPNIVFCEYQGTGNLFRSTDGGAGFNASAAGIDTADRNCFLPPYEFDPSNSNRLVYGTHRVYQSVNGGANWSAISPDLTATSGGAIRSLAIAPSNSQCIWVVTNDGNVQVTFNGGGLWTLVRQNVPGWGRLMRQVTVAADDARVAYVAASAYGAAHVLRTTNGGQNWTAMDGNLPDLPANVIAVDVRPAVDVLYVGMDASVYQSLDAGVHWRLFGVALPSAPVIDLRLDAARGRLVAATQGRGLWQIPIWLPGDINADGVVSMLDIPLFVSVLLDQPADVDTRFRCDVNGDGAADGQDIQAFLYVLPQ